MSTPSISRTRVETTRPLRSARHWYGRSAVSVLVVGITFLVTGCSPSALVDVQSPSTTVDPSLVHTASAAIQLRATALNRMMGAFGGSGNGNDVVGMSGELTDELAGTVAFASNANGDDRNVLNQTFPKNTNGYGYDQIQSARIKNQQARQALVLYASDAPGAPRAWQGELMALEGYTILWFAELYCSGIPLTTAPLVGAQIPTRGFTTEELYARAIALFDSAMVAGADSAQYVNLARVGKARALLNQGQFLAADSVVQSVPTDFVYFLRSATSSDDGWAYFAFPVFVARGDYRVQDNEGGNGLVWSTDPRTGVTTVPDVAGDMLWPAKYNVDPSTGALAPTTELNGMSVRLADGLEARLIQAEAALSAGDASWLTTLNMLRSTCVGTAACAPVPGITAGQLPPLSDPVTPEARLDTLMKERAMWLYLTGHREGDLRRMARVYGRDPETLWPTGTIRGPAFPDLWSSPVPGDGLPYGSDVVYGPDVNEHLRNSLYGGCTDTNP